jgi:hypothetical protein
MAQKKERGMAQKKRRKIKIRDIKLKNAKGDTVTGGLDKPTFGETFMLGLKKSP